MKILHSVLLTLAAVSALPVTAAITDTAVQQSLHQMYGLYPADYVISCAERLVVCDANDNVISIRHVINIPDHLSVDMSVFSQLLNYNAYIHPDMKNQSEILPASLTQLTMLKNVKVHAPEQDSFNLPLMKSVENIQITASTSIDGAIFSVPATLAEYNSLTELTVVAKNIDFSAVNSLAALQVLKVTQADSVVQLPINTMTDLRQFSWVPRSITAFEQYMLYLSQLDKLDNYSLSFIDMGLTEIPESLGSLPGLESLDLSKNNITSIPQGLLNSAELKTLNLNSNKITSLPDNVMFSSLQSLNLASNQLTALPENIGTWSELKKLDLYHNRLTSVPETLTDLTKLEELDISQNRLRKLPVKLLTLPQLTQLKLDSNWMTGTLDENLFLTLGANLETLDLSNNKLQGKLPDFTANHLGKPEIRVHNNALWHTDTVILDKYSAVLGWSILDSQLLPPRGVRVVERDEFWTIEWGFPLMHDTAGTHIRAAYYEGKSYDPLHYTSHNYRITIERAGEETEVIEMFCRYAIIFKYCPSDYSANYQSFDTDYRNLTAIYRYTGDLKGATISVSSYLGYTSYIDSESSASVAGQQAEHEMYLDELDYQLQQVPELAVKGSTSYAMLIFLASLLLLGLSKNTSTHVVKKFYS